MELGDKIVADEEEAKTELNETQSEQGAIV